MYGLNPMGDRPGLPGIVVESTAATVAANGGLSTLRFNILTLVPLRGRVEEEKKKKKKKKRNSPLHSSYKFVSFCISTEGIKKRSEVNIFFETPSCCNLCTKQ